MKPYFKANANFVIIIPLKGCSSDDQLKKKCILRGNMKLESVVMFLFLMSPQFDLERKEPEVAAYLLLAWLARHPSNELRRKEFEQVEKQDFWPCFLNH